MNRNFPLLFSTVTAFVLLAGSANGQPESRDWSSQLLETPAAWSNVMNDAIVRSTPQGLHVEIARDKSWAIAAAPMVRIPSHTTRIWVRIRKNVGGGRWLVRLYGDLRSNGTNVTVGPFENMTTVGNNVIELDPRLFGPANTGTAKDVGGKSTVMLQLGVEGPAGATTEFEAVEFTQGAGKVNATHIPGQINLPSVDLMPDIPHPFKMIDWRARAIAFDKLAFDLHAKGEFLPLIWIDNAHINIDAPTFGIPSYVGDEREKGSGQESVTCMGAVLGATVAGIDKSRQEHDYVKMCEAFYNRKNGSNLVLDNQDQPTGGSFWYEIWPHIVFYAIADRYPAEKELAPIVSATADRWAEAVDALGGNLNHTAFNFATQRAVDNGQWKEPDSAAGIAWMELAAWTKFHTPKYRDAADTCIRFLQSQKTNPYYENLLPWGALAAARMNAELGRDYDVRKMLNWCFDISDTRGGWGVTVQNWGGYDCQGLVGSVDNRGGYAFAMNTYAQAAALTPLVRYDTRFACAIGKWMLNLTNNARLFYPGELPVDQQSSGFWKGDPAATIAYEGLRREWMGKSPCATGDPVFLKWGPKTDLGLYGAAYAGLLGGIVHPTDDPHIPLLDCLATDFCRTPAYPSSLCYNPYAEAKRVRIDLGPEWVDLYDAVTDSVLFSAVRGNISVPIPAKHAHLLIRIPAGAKRSVLGKTVLYNGVAVRYNVGS